MALTSAASTKSTTDTATGSFTYINGLLSAAAGNGLYSIHIDGQYVNDSMTGSFVTQGYRVTKKYTDMGTYPTYMINW